MHTFLVSKVWCSGCLWHSQHVIRLVYSGKVFSIRLTYQPNAVFKKQPDSPFVTASWDSIWSLPRRWQLKVRRLLSFCCFCVWKCISFRYSPFVCLLGCLLLLLLFSIMLSLYVLPFFHHHFILFIYFYFIFYLFVVLFLFICFFCFLVFFSSSSYAWACGTVSLRRAVSAQCAQRHCFGCM